MSLLKKAVDKLFLIKEIVSKEGVVHFRRYRLMSTPWFNLYVHNIRKSDEDKYPHDHPWDFKSLILSGSYQETMTLSPHNNYGDDTYTVKYHPGELAEHKAEDTHKITLLTPEVWTLVLTTGRARIWGYQTPKGFINHAAYRILKNAGKLS